MWSDQIMRQVAHSLREANRAPVVEPRDLHGSTYSSRPDIRTIGEVGGEDLLDIGVTHCLTPSAVARHTTPSANLRKRYDKKLKQHAAYADAIPGAITRPIIIAASGGYHPASADYLDNIIQSASRRNHVPLAELRSITHQLIAASLVSHNVRCFLDGATSTNELNAPTARHLPASTVSNSARQLIDVVARTEDAQASATFSL